MRLAKYLAHCGVASRRRAEELIVQRRVRVGGETVTDPARDVGEYCAFRESARATGVRSCPSLARSGS